MSRVLQYNELPGNAYPISGLVEEIEMNITTVKAGGMRLRIELLPNGRAEFIGDRKHIKRALKAQGLSGNPRDYL